MDVPSVCISGQLLTCPLLASPGTEVATSELATAVEVKLLWFFWTKFGKGKVWDHAHVQDVGGREFDRVVEKAGFRVLKDKRFLLGMVRALKLTPA